MEDMKKVFFVLRNLNLLAYKIYNIKLTLLFIMLIMK